MQFITTRVHGVLDYVVGIALILAPMIFGFTDVGGYAVMVPRVLGIGLIVYSLITNYELGVFKVLPMKVHLVIDFIAALFLAVSPWLFKFSGEMANAWMPHLIVGIVVMIVVLTSQSQPSTQQGGMGGGMM